ncbi:hypothetical protein L1049_006834 [Liquidambar formosana]|uniref:NADP-dependent oxidoreductase domain-containing protein n=1 Tax=Liquidambar formosana TaxID=63359 RepID=A0AAP0RG48_LIQFO
MDDVPEVPMISIIPTVTLNSSSGGRRMPIIGMGTADDPSRFDAAALKSAVLSAIELGYRHFDAAVLYQTEETLGEAIAEALRRGLVDSRDELFITSKLVHRIHPRCLDYPLLEISNLIILCRTLQLEYLDLYLIHWPISAKPGKCVYPIKHEDLLPMDYKSVWEAMEECQRLGLTKSIGVCNFTCKKLENLLAFATIPPSVNQVEMSPVWQQKKLREFCKANGIILTAYSPLGGKGTRWGTTQVMECQVLKAVAEARGKTIAQVSLRWVYEQGVSFLVKSFNKERMKENLKIFDWSLTEDDYKKINKIQQNRGMPKLDFVSVHGPFKSVQELWDGEI